MAMTACKECGKDISDTAEACPHCGAKVPRQAKTKWWLWVPIGAISAFMLVGFVGSNTPEERAKSDARYYIDFCWQEAKKHPGNPVAEGACRLMEDEFRQKFNQNP